MDINKIFTALNGFPKSCWWLLLLLTRYSWICFQFKSKSLWTDLTDWQSLTKLETILQVQLQMPELLALLEQPDLVTLNVLVSWLTLLALRTSCLVTLLEPTGLLAINGLAIWVTLLILQTLCSVALL